MHKHAVNGTVRCFVTPAAALNHGASKLSIVCGLKKNAYSLLPWLTSIRSEHSRSLLSPFLVLSSLSASSQFRLYFIPLRNMSSYFSFHRTVSKPIEDAPITRLPQHEASALDALDRRLNHIFLPSNSKLHAHDPWLTLTEQQRHCLLIRFLRYNLLHIDNACSHIHKVATWRSTQRPWNLLLSDMQGTAAGIPILSDVIRGRDGDVLVFIPTRYYQKSLVKRSEQNIAIKAFFEYCSYATHGLKATSGVMLVDFASLQLKQVDLVALKNAINIFLSFYPEVLRKVILFNYPRWIHGTWKCIVPLLDARTIAKVVWVHNRDALRNELQKYYDPEHLPLWLGGEGKNGTMQLHSGYQMCPEECMAKLWS